MGERGTAHFVLDRRCLLKKFLGRLCKTVMLPLSTRKKITKSAALQESRTARFESIESLDLGEFHMN